MLGTLSKDELLNLRRRLFRVTSLIQDEMVVLLRTVHLHDGALCAGHEFFRRLCPAPSEPDGERFSGRRRDKDEDRLWDRSTDAPRPLNINLQNCILTTLKRITYPLRGVPYERP